jgi:outer membrane protein assembly factor BamA
LYDLDVFRVVQVDLLGDGALRDLVLSVEERPRYAFELGAGVSTDQGLRGFGRITRRNLFGRAHRVSVYGLVGLDWRSDSLRDWTPDITDPEWRAALTYDAPRFPVRGQHLVVDVLLRERVQERTWQMSRSGLGVALESRVGTATTVRAQLRGQLRRFEQVDPGAFLPGEPWSSLVDVTDPTLPSPWRFQDSLSALILHDRRDNPLSPTRGFNVTALAELAPGLKLGPGGVAFVRGELRGGAYVPIRGFVLRLSGEGGHARALGDDVIALEDRYRLGGTGSLRGFLRDVVGPRNQIDVAELGWSDRIRPVIDATLAQDPTRWVPTGGDARALGSVELLAPLPALGMPAWDGYAAAIFADFGNVWLTRRDPLATSEEPAVRDVFDPVLRYSVGAGVRVATPVGPLQVDLAANPAAIQATGAQKTLLRQEWREPLLRAHLSLGTLF